MKSIVARTTLVAVWICLLVGFTATRLHAGEYFIYQDAKGRLIISNQKPPPGSKIIKQQTLFDTAESETTLVQDGNEMRPNENATPPKPSKQGIRPTRPVAPMDSALTFTAISYRLVVPIWLTTVALLWISMTKEWRLDQTLSGVFGLIVAALCLCAFIVLVAAYVKKTRSLRMISHRVELVTSNGEFRP